MIWGAHLLIVFWPFTFHHCIHIKNAASPHCGALTSADKKSSGEKSDPAELHTFGCRVWVKHASAKSKKCNMDAKKGCCLGHVPGAILKNALWVNDAAGRVKLGCHQRFDEGMNDLALSELPPNARVFHHSGKIPAPGDPPPTKQKIQPCSTLPTLPSSWK
jgi:hypothetical protein